MSVLGKRYAAALFQAASDAAAIDQVAADLGRVAAALRDGEVRAILFDPWTPRAALERIVGGGHELTRNVISVLLGRRRESILPELEEAFADLVRQARGEAVGVVETAKAISDDELRAIEACASATVGAKVSLSVDLNPDLIGGIRVRVGNTLYDGSVATALEDLERRLVEAPL